MNGVTLPIINLGNIRPEDSGVAQNEISNTYKLSWSGIMFSIKSWISSKIDMYRFDAYTGWQTTKPLNDLFRLRAQIASNVLNDGRGWISVFNLSDTSMPTLQASIRLKLIVE